jgi:phosphohistidine phosphatase
VKSVWILRHGKAASKSTKGDDHGRALTARGRRQSAEVATYVAQKLSSGTAAPDMVVSSSAARARATAEPVHAALGDGVPMDIEPELYGADADDVVDRLRLLADDIDGVMIVGHNPTFQDLALLLVSPDDGTGHSRLEDGFPTAALAVVTFDIPKWGQLAAGGGHLEDFFVPSR